MKQYKLMPMGNGQLFLPVKAAIRKKIGKEAGDYVNVILQIDTSAHELPQDILDCFRDVSPKVYKAFMALSAGEQKRFIDSVASVKKESTKTQRILKMIEALQRNIT